MQFDSLNHLIQTVVIRHLDWMIVGDTFRDMSTEGGVAIATGGLSCGMFRF